MFVAHLEVVGHVVSIRFLIFIIIPHIIWIVTILHFTLIEIIGNNNLFIEIQFFSYVAVGGNGGCVAL